MKKHAWDIIISIVLVGFSLAIWLPSRYYPLFWDATYVVKTASQILDSNFTRLVSQEQGYAHPTFIPIILAILWKIFGSSATVGHYVTLPFLPMLLICAYFYITSKTNRKFGFLGAMLIAVTPTVLAEYVNVYTDLPVAALIAASLLCWEKKKYLPWGIVYSLAILTKITALPIALYFFLSALLERDKKRIMASSILPMGVMGAWLLYHHAVSGFWLLRISTGFSLSVTNGVGEVLRNWVVITSKIFSDQLKWLVVLIALSSLVINQAFIKRKLSKADWQHIAIMVIPIFASALLFAATGEFSQRYAIAVNTLFYAAMLQIIYLSLEKNVTYTYAAYFLLIASTVLMINTWRPKEATITNIRTPAPTDLGIVDYIEVFRWLTTYIQIEATSPFEIYGTFPENVAFSMPVMGFVHEPIEVKPCADFQFKPNIKQYIVFHPFSPTNYGCYQLIQSGQARAVANHESNGKWVDLYSAATPSASKK